MIEIKVSPEIGAAITALLLECEGNKDRALEKFVSISNKYKKAKKEAIRKYGRNNMDAVKACLIEFEELYTIPHLIIIPAIGDNYTIEESGEMIRSYIAKLDKLEAESERSGGTTAFQMAEKFACLPWNKTR